jgi:hypothetical protein
MKKKFSELLEIQNEIMYNFTNLGLETIDKEKERIGSHI